MSRFDRARRLANLRRFLTRLGALEPARLLPFEEVRDSLKLRHLVDRGVHEVPLDKIVGSLGRASEFDRAFLPRRESSRDRWERIARLTDGPVGFPPVELYQVGDAFFVIDGHHRISVLQSLGAPAVEAHVKEFLTPVPLAPEDSIEAVILRRGQADFLEVTGLVPQGDRELLVSIANGYERLLEHISVHRYFRGIEERREISWKEAVDSWYHQVYRPVIDALEGSRILESFPERTTADLYLFVMEHLQALRDRYGGGSIVPEAAVDDFSELHAPRHRSQARFERFWRWLGWPEEEPVEQADDAGEAEPFGDETAG